MCLIVARIDPKELDPLLAEVTLLNARAELYTRFVRRRVMVRFDYGSNEITIRFVLLMNQKACLGGSLVKPGFISKHI